MTDYEKRIDRTEEQARVLAEAMTLLIDARRKAATMIRDSGAELTPEERDFVGRPCMAELEHPPTPHTCGCRAFKGPDSTFCIGKWFDSTVPDVGSPPGMQVCGHPESDHVEI